MVQATIEDTEAAAQADESRASAVETDETTGPIVVDLPAQADIRVAAEVVELLRAALASEGDVEIRCGAVERLDAAVAQCLTALAGGLRQGGRQLLLTERTASFDRAIAVIGVDAELGASVGDEGRG